MKIRGSRRSDTEWHRFTHYDVDGPEEEVDLRVRFITPSQIREVQAPFMERKQRSGGQTVEEMPERNARKFGAALMDRIVVDWGGEDRVAPMGAFCQSCGKLQYHRIAEEHGVQCCECEQASYEARPLPCKKGYKVFFFQYCARYCHDDDPGLWDRVRRFATRGDRSEVPEDEAENLEPTPPSEPTTPSSTATAEQ